jgi:PAS domain S-box-containing protein
VKDTEKTKEQLLSELADLRNHVAELQDVKKELADLLPQIVFETDAQGNFTYVNRHGYEMVGYTPEDVKKGINALDVIVPEDRPAAADNIGRALSGQKIENLRTNFTILRKDGSTFPALIWPAIIMHDGKPMGIRGVCVDVSEMKQTEEALRKSEERYRSLVDNAQEAIVVAQDSMMKFFNAKTAEITGYPPGELTAIPFLDVIHPDDRQMVLDRHLRRLKGEEFPNVYPIRIIRKDGSVKWLELNAVLISWNGKPATLNFLSDVTERTNTEEALRQSEEKLRLTFEAIEDSIIIIDPEGRVLEANESAIRLAGFKNRPQASTLSISSHPKTASA